jgi:hypothetical protein
LLQSFVESTKASSVKIALLITILIIPKTAKLFSMKILLNSLKSIKTF